MSTAPTSARPVRKNGTANKLAEQDRAVHDWYRFVLSYPPHLVGDYLHRFGLNSSHRVLDPFCGTGTTLVECQKHGVPVVGVEAHPMAYFASQIKMDWNLNPDGLLAHAQMVAEETLADLEAQGIFDDSLPLFSKRTNLTFKLNLRRLPPEQEQLLLTDCISPLPLHKTLTLLDRLAEEKASPYVRHERLALAKTVVSRVSNLHFGPEVGVGELKSDVPVVSLWLDGVHHMADDLRRVWTPEPVDTQVYHADARDINRVITPCSIDAVITSPPYPNEKDYTRTTRLESVLLGFLRNRADLKALKRQLVRSNTRGVYKEDDDDQWIAAHPFIEQIARTIEARRLELGKTSGFERLYPRVTRLYFGGMARHLAELRQALRPNAQLAYVVGDQASYLRVMIRTGQLLAQIAESLGYEVTSIDLFRTRLATATREQLREEVVVLRWPGFQGTKKNV